MAVSRLSSANPLQYLSASRPAKSAVSELSTTENVLSSLSDTQEERIKRFDFTHMRPHEMLETMNTLIKAGQMTVDESSGIMGVMPSPLAQNYEEQMNTPMNFIAALNQQMQFNLNNNNLTGAEYDRKGLAALMRLQGTIAGIDLAA